MEEAAHTHAHAPHGTGFRCPAPAVAYTGG